MTKSRGIGRGGARPNSGPRKSPPIERPAHTGLTAQELAKTRLDLAFATLDQICAEGVTEGAKVAAARVIIETANGKFAKVAAEDAPKPADKWGSILDEVRPN